MEDIMANYSKIIAKALGKRRMAKIITIDSWGDLMIDIPMKNGWLNDNEETTIFAEWEGDPEIETWQEFIKYLKRRVDEFKYTPEPNPLDGIEWPTETNDYDETPCGDPHCCFCGEPHDEMEVA
jgi:hypothetical protein